MAPWLQRRAAVTMQQAAAGGPVVSLATAGGGSALQSLCQGPGGGMKVWDRLDLSLISSAGGHRTEAPAEMSKTGRPRKLREEASAMAVSGEWTATAYRDNKIRLYRLGNTVNRQLLSAATPAGLQHLGSLPSRAEYLKNWAWGRKYVGVRRGQGSRPWMEHADAISALAFSSVGHALLYSASWDKSVKVWSLQSMACLESFKAHDDAISAMIALDEHPSCSSSGGLGLLFTASADETIKVWSRRKLRNNRHALVVSLQGHSAAVNALALAPRSQSGRSCCIRLYSGGSDGRIMVWSSTNCKHLHHRHTSTVGYNSGGASSSFSMELQETLSRGHKRAVLCLELVQLRQQGAEADHIDDQFLLVSGSADKTIRLWSENTSMGGAGHQCIAVLAGHGAHAAPVKSLRACTLHNIPAKTDHYLHGNDEYYHDRGTNTSRTTASSPSARHVLLYSGDLAGCIKMWLLSCNSTPSTNSAAAAPADSEPVITPHEHSMHALLNAIQGWPNYLL